MLTGADLTTEPAEGFRRRGHRRARVQRPHRPGFAFAGAVRPTSKPAAMSIEQYNRPGNDLKTDQLAPYSLHLSGERVTDETAPVTFLAPDHPVLNTPNKITSADFDGWIQERGIYYPEPVGRTFHADPRVQRSRRSAAQGRPARRAIRQGLFRLYRPGVFPANCPPACPAPTGCLPIWFHSENESLRGQRRIG